MNAKNLLLLFLLIASIPYVWGESLAGFEDGAIGAEFASKDEFYRKILMEYSNQGEVALDSIEAHAYAPYLDDEGNLVTSGQEGLSGERLSFWRVFLLVALKEQDNVEILLYAIETFLYDNRQLEQPLLPHQQDLLIDAAFE